MQPSLGVLKQPIVNMEEQPGKTVGRLVVGPETYDALVDQAMAIMPRLPFPKGVFRFGSHEEANQWMEKHILEAAARKRRSSQKGEIG